MRTLLTFFLLFCPLGVLAQGDAPVRYISDEISVTLRKGEGMSAEVASLVKAGTRVELLETGSEGYARVRVAAGREGWVLAKYLSESPSAREQLESLNAKLAEREAQVNELQGRVAEMETRLQAESEPGPDEMALRSDAPPGQTKLARTLTGAALVIIGVLLGMIFSQVTRKRRKKWSPEF